MKKKFFNNANKTNLKITNWKKKILIQKGKYFVVEQDLGDFDLYLFLPVCILDAKYIVYFFKIKKKK